MKIVILVAGFPPKWLAGTEIATYHIAKHLAKLGHSVHVVTSLDKGQSRESTEAGFYVHRFPPIRVPYLFAPSLVIPTLQVVKRIGPDVIHAQSVLMGLVSFLVKKATKIPYAVYSRGELYMPVLINAPLAKLVFRNADAVIALTGDMRKSIAKFYAGSIDVIPNGIELEDFTNLSRERARRKLNVDGDEKVIMFVGRFRPEKNVACLIQAMKIVAERNHRVRLFVVGEGPEEEKLRKLTKELNLELKVNFVGQVVHEKVPEYLIAADVLVLPSLSEGFPVVLPEAMACGLPIVAARVGGVPEIVIDGENGLLVDPRKPEQVAEAVLKILENYDLATKMSANNIASVRQYSWKTTAEKLVEVYRKIADAS